MMIDLMVWKVQFKFWWGLAGHNWLKILLRSCEQKILLGLEFE